MELFIRTLYKANNMLAVLFIILAVLLFAARDLLTVKELKSNSRSDQQTFILTTTITNNNTFKDRLSNSSIIQAKQTDNNAIIRIPSIGVDTKLYIGDDPNTLEKGVWALPGYGLPAETPSESPIVVAAHRWGADDTPYEVRAKHLFFNLPSVDVGDVIEIVWQSKVFRYKVNFKEESNYVSKLEDLILVTCKYYDSLERIFVYAEKI